MWSIQHVSLFEAGACLLAPEIQRFFKQLRPEPGEHGRISIILLATTAALEPFVFHRPKVDRDVMSPWQQCNNWIRPSSATMCLTSPKKQRAIFRLLPVDQLKKLFQDSDEDTGALRTNAPPTPAAGHSECHKRRLDQQ